MDTFVRLFRKDAEDTWVLYAGTHTDALQLLRDAFVIDLAKADSAHGIAFCGGRLALLDAVLKMKARQTRPTP